MAERTRIIILTVIFGGGSFLFALMMFWPNMSPQVAYDAAAGFITRGRVDTDTITFGSTVSMTEGRSVTFEDGLVVSVRAIDNSSGESAVTLDIKHGSRSSTRGASGSVRLAQRTSPEVSVAPYLFGLASPDELGEVSISVAIE